uniref:Uncharacterized protein n=1 Tax=Arundo donax TaxID=35708 RepID=A0A0A8ZB01_ARUDO
MKKDNLVKISLPLWTKLKYKQNI